MEHKGHYKGGLLKLEQTNIITNITEDYEQHGNRFVCVLTFDKCSNGQRCRFQSEQACNTKQEAKESAAKRAVLFLGERNLGYLFI